MARRKDPVTEPSQAEALPPAAAEIVVPPAPEPERDAQPDVPPEVGPTPDPQQETQPAPQPVAAPSARRGGVFWPLVGGALAAAGGFAVGQFDLLGLAPPDRDAEIESLRAEVQALAGAAPPAVDLSPLQGALAGLEDRLAALETAPAPGAERIDALEAQLAEIAAMPGEGTAANAARLAALERQLAERPASVDTAEIDAALERLATAEAEAEARAAEAEATASAAERTQALVRLRAAAAAGADFRAELDALGDTELTGQLAPHASGVATLATLQAEFPEPARQALQIDRAAADGDGWGTRFVDFLAAQTGARSLTPREGEAVDAVLSRAEFALAEGRLADALAEVESLAPELQMPFADWLERARARLAVDTALEGL